MQFDSPLSRRTFLAGLAASCAASAWAQSPPRAAWSGLELKLSAGKSVTLLIVSDSTGYPETSATRRFIRWLATKHTGHFVTESLWAEWVTNAPTGPRNYGEPIVIADRAQARLTVLNAALPGAVAQAMIDGSRWSNMLAPLHGAAPDLILWNHGHNHQANIAPKQFPYGRGTFLAPIGRIMLEFPNVPQAAIVQNPWRDNDGYDRVRDWWLATAKALPGLTLIDGHTPFLQAGKKPELYRDNVHPSAQGYELIYQQLIASWTASPLTVIDFPPHNWPHLPVEPLVANGDLADWTGDLPRNWRLIHNAAVRKDSTHTFRGAPWSLALTGTTQNDGLQLSITGPALARVRGKSVSFAVLCYVPHEAEQDIQVKFTTNSSDQVTGSIQFARDNWKWIVMAGVPIAPDATLAFISIMRSFAKPPTDVPFYIQRAMIVEGDVPRGGMGGM